MKKYILIILFLIVLLAGLNAQSYHFSQFFSTPLLINPANTGYIEGPYRLATNFKSQGMIGGSPYFTGYLSADISLMRNRLAEGDKAGVGMYIMNDQSLSGAFQTNSVGFSAAYNIILDEDGYYSLGVGLQGTYYERKIDYTRLSFESQFTPQGYVPGSSIGESLPSSNMKKRYVDANAGIMYHANLENEAFFAGFAIYNTMKHKENILAEQFKMPTRYTLQAGGRLDVSATGSFYFSLISMLQSKATETTAGIAYGILLSEDAKKEVDFGMWYRNKDALIPYIGYQTNGFQIGFTFDYTVSAGKTAAQVRNGYELTLLYNAPDNRELKRLIPWY